MQRGERGTGSLRVLPEMDQHRNGFQGTCPLYLGRAEVVPLGGDPTAGGRCYRKKYSDDFIPDYCLRCWDHYTRGERGLNSEYNKDSGDV